MTETDRWERVVSKPWEAAWRLREAVGELMVSWNVENLTDVRHMLEDEGVCQALVRSVLGADEWEVEVWGAGESEEV